MAKLRHRLTQLFWILAACETSDPDPEQETEPFKLCDGSQEIRLGYQSGGGFVDEGYAFEQPYGFQYLFVDGQCDFTLATYEDDRPGKFVQGHLSDDAAAELEQRLGLASLPHGTFLDTLTCPDAGSVSLATSQFYGDCTCDCDKGAPAGLRPALSAMGDTLEFLRAFAAAGSGDVELAAKRQDAQKGEVARPWPFAWPVTDIENAALYDPRVAVKLRLLQGADAQTARDFFAEARKERVDAPVFVTSGGSLFRVYLRERVDPELAQRIERFRLASDPRLQRPIATCERDATVSASFGIADVQQKYLYAMLDSTPVCGARICWDGDLSAQKPVTVPLRVVHAAMPRPCLGVGQTSFELDLTPIVEAHHTKLPNSPVDIDLTLSGWSGKKLKLTE